jgi:predicted membrane-bound spermidine synthase
LGLFLLAAATFAFEISLTRVFAIAQFYHFAFMAVSLALLGFGASGSLLTIRPRWAGEGWPRRLGWLAVAFGLSVPASYICANRLPFDSYSIAWDARQAGYLLLYYLLLVLPFALGGLVVSIALAAVPQRVNRTYAANLAGSAAGCLLAIAVLPWLGGPRTIAASGLLGCLGAMAFAWGAARSKSGPARAIRPGTIPTLGAVLAAAFVSWLLVANPPFSQIQLSPYKGLSQALRYPGSRVILSDWNAYSRVDLLESQGTRQLPGLSYAYTGTIPSQLGLAIDGDDLSPVPLIASPDTDLDFGDYLPSAVAYKLRPGARALVLEPRGGLELWAALAGGASAVTVVESNPELLGAAQHGAATRANDPYQDWRVSVVREEGRSYLSRVGLRYDLVVLPLTQPYRPVMSGAYSLAEDYTLTIGAFRDYLAHLESDGLLVVTRWLQTPPSDSARTLGLILEALDREGAVRPGHSVIAFRGVQTVTFLVSTSAFSAQDVEVVKDFCASRRFDLVVGPGIGGEDINRYNVLPEPYYASTYAGLMGAADRSSYYADYGFDITPPTDDRPFFYHFFRWTQTPAIVQNLGKTWQPFGGSGIFVLVALLLLAVLTSAALIVGPLLVNRRTRSGAPEAGNEPARRRAVDPGGRSGASGRLAASAQGEPARQWGVGGVRLAVFPYFGLLGLGYLFVEIPLIQRFILYLGRPVYAMSAVLFTLLLFSGLGSLSSRRMPHRRSLGILALAAIALLLLLPRVLGMTLGLALGSRFAVAVVLLAPLGFLMGVPFPKGIRLLHDRSPELIPWAWAVNGCVSVLSSILAALGALSWGFSSVLVGGAVCYGLAALCVRPGVEDPAASPARGSMPAMREG